MFLSSSFQQKLTLLCKSGFYEAFAFDYVSSVDSTNSALLARARGGDLSARVLVAQRQTAGRGRQGRVWHSTLEQQQALTLSVGLATPLQQLNGLSLAIGARIATALHPQIQLKWPNDLLLQQGKLGGILLETAKVGTTKYLVIGVGINLQLPRNAALDDMRLPAVALDAVSPKLTAEQVTEQVIRSIIGAYIDFKAKGFAAFAEHYRQRDFLWQQPVRLSSGVTGVAQGVGSDGELLVQTADELIKVFSDEVSVLLR